MGVFVRNMSGLKRTEFAMKRSIDMAKNLVNETIGSHTYILGDSTADAVCKGKKKGLCSVYCQLYSHFLQQE